MPATPTGPARRALPRRHDAAAQADALCSDRVGPLVLDGRLDDFDVYDIYPDSPLSWGVDSSVMCIVTAADDGTIMGTASKQP